MKERIKDLYENTQLTLQQIADTVGTSLKIVWRYTKDNYSKEYRTTRKVKNYSVSKLGENNPCLGKRPPNYKGDCFDGKGYLTVCKPTWYTGRPKYARVFKHHIVVCTALGLTEIPRGYCVHHIDGDKTNNSIDNLLLLTLSAHTKLHQSLRNRAET